MARIAPLEYEQASPAARVQYDEIVAAHGRVTNMKRTLGHSPVALEALMRWYPLRDEVQSFLGPRATTLFVHAVSSATDCLICSTFFRRILIDAGEDPDQLQLDAREQAVVDFGRQLVFDANRVTSEMYDRLAEFLSPAQIVALTALGGLMIATNVFNNALGIELDDYLQSYRRPNGEGQPAAGAERGHG